MVPTVSEQRVGLEGKAVRPVPWPNPFLRYTFHRVEIVYSEGNDPF